MLTTRINGFVFHFYQWPEDNLSGVWHYAVEDKGTNPANWRLSFGHGVDLLSTMIKASMHAERL
jgi:hypothetical protein